MFNFRRREIPWEVVDSKSVEPVPMYYGDDGKLSIYIYLKGTGSM